MCRMTSCRIIEIVDDTPEPPSLDERKMLLASKLDAEATSRDACDCPAVEIASHEHPGW